MASMPRMAKATMKQTAMVVHPMDSASVVGRVMSHRIMNARMCTTNATADHACIESARQAALRHALTQLWYLEWVFF